MRIDPERLRLLATDLLAALGAARPVAERVAGSLVLADLRGIPTHGLSLLPLYAQMIRAGAIDPSASPRRQALGACLARVDGNRALGQVSARLAVDTGLEMLREHGIAAVGIADGTHLGRLGEWAERACDDGAAFFAFTNTGGGALNVAGPGGAQRVLSTNPLALGVPSLGALEHHLVVDFAASQVSGSRIREVANAGGQLSADWVVADGDDDALDPDLFLAGAAALRPLGGRTAGHKGFGLMAASEMLAALAGGMMAGERDAPWFSNGALFLFLDIERFTDAAQWRSRATGFRDYLRSRGYRMPGSGTADVGADGYLAVSDHVVDGLVSLCMELDVDARGLTGSGSSDAVTLTW